MSSHYHYTKPIYKQLTRFGIFIKKKRKIRKRNPREKSRYHEKLEEKQKLRFYHGIGEKQLRKYIYISKKSKEPTNEALTKLLFMRLDHVIVNLGICHTIFEARQYISHKNILINNNLVNFPNHCCNINDEITILSSKKKLIVSKKKLVNEKEWISLKSNKTKIIEYYSNIKN
uniref:Small ribosomal subunit protein uS4c n=2 Tax=Hydnora visseri TaxID=1329980 RepID=A0A0X9MDD8_HYDVS|nr:ribosomal protein S4 [Hydnora visseri]ALZ49980.1 ribosomal protein S4 [Hydnora visseri]